MQGKEDKAVKGRGGKTTSGIGHAWSWQVPEGNGGGRKLVKTGCKVICGSATPVTDKGLMVMM